MTSVREFFGGRYPTAKEVRGITDESQLQSFFDSISLDIAHLEARLEYLSDEDAPREKGLRNALAFARSSLGAIQKQQSQLKVTVSQVDAMALAKSREVRTLAAAEQVKAAHEMARIKFERALENQRFQETQARSKLIKSVSWHVCFTRAARKILSEETLSEIQDAADADYLERFQEEAYKKIRKTGDGEP